MAKIYTPSTSRATLGIYVSDDHSNIFLVEVKQRVQSTMYTFIMDGDDKRRNTAFAHESWEELRDMLSAELEVIPAKHLSKQFDIYKQGVKLAKEQRQLLKAKQSGEASDGHEELCSGLPWQ